jgi:hypothetical protein
MPMLKADFQALADIRVREAGILLAAGEWDGAYYLAGYGVECGLKACIIRRLNTSDVWPEKSFMENCYKHDLKLLLKLADLEAEMNAAGPVLGRWNLVNVWTEQSRYERGKVGGGAVVDQGPLVESQIVAGARLVEELIARGVDVTSAFWVRAGEEREWTLYLASKVYDEGGPLAASSALVEAVRRVDDSWLSFSDVRAIGASDPITAAVLEIRRRRPAWLPAHVRRPRLGNLGAEEVYVYPLPPGGVADERWRGIEVKVFKEAGPDDGYYVEFWPHEPQALRLPGTPPRRVPRPAGVRVKDGAVVDYRPPEKPLSHLSQRDYEQKAVEAVEQVAAQPV